MIRKMKVGGRPAIVIFLGEGLKPVADEKDATLIKVDFLDDGSIVWLTPESAPAAAQ